MEPRILGWNQLEWSFREARKGSKGRKANDLEDGIEWESMRRKGGWNKRRGWVAYCIRSFFWILFVCHLFCISYPSGLGLISLGQFASVFIMWRLPPLPHHHYHHRHPTFSFLLLLPSPVPFPHFIANVTISDIQQGSMLPFLPPSLARVLTLSVTALPNRQNAFSPLYNQDISTFFLLSSSTYFHFLIYSFYLLQSLSTKFTILFPTRILPFAAFHLSHAPSYTILLAH